MSILSNKLQNQLDELIEEGYQLLFENDDAGTCDVWFNAWSLIKKAMDEHGIENIEAFDRQYKRRESIYNWSADFESALGNAALDDPAYWEKQIQFCSEYIKRYGDPSEHNILNMKRAIAESYFHLGQPKKGGKLFEQLTLEYPFWSWGWISWSDMYWSFGEEKDKDSNKAVGILLKGLEEKELDDRHEVQSRLKELFLDLGKQEEADAIVIEEPKRKVLDRKPSATKQKPIKVEKVGRNEPCPCGSGNKYKKCCGAN